MAVTQEHEWECTPLQEEQEEKEGPQWRNVLVQGRCQNNREY